MPKAGGTLRGASLTSAEKKAVELWQTNYYAINKYIRSGEMNKTITSVMTDEEFTIGDIVKNLDSAIAKSRTTKPMIVYRLTSSKQSSNSSYSATSKDLSTLLDGRDYHGIPISKQIVLKIKVPAGTALLNVNKSTTRAGKIIYSNEKEFLLPRNTKFTYGKQSTVKGIPIIDTSIK